MVTFMLLELYMLLLVWWGGGNKSWFWSETIAHNFYIMLQAGGHKSIIVFYCAINPSNRTFKYAKDCCRTRLDAFSHSAFLSFFFFYSFESDLLLI